jgi:hypothetical protein
MHCEGGAPTVRFAPVVPWAKTGPDCDGSIRHLLEFDFGTLSRRMYRLTRVTRVRPDLVVCAGGTNAAWRTGELENIKGISELERCIGCALSVTA